MDYQHNINLTQIKYLDYMGLVSALSMPLQPETRAVILQRLTEMNDRVLRENQNLQTDLSRSSQLNSRKKDVQEVVHPSLDRYNNKGQNPIPINFTTNYSPTSPVDQFDVDDLINDIHSGSYPSHTINKPETLDDKLSRINSLHKKLMQEKRQRRRERELNSK
jgi:hypothetical protein